MKALCRWSDEKWKIFTSLLLYRAKGAIFATSDGVIIVNRGTGYETFELSKARTMLLQWMLNWPWPCTIFCFRFARVRKLVAHDLIEGFDWLSSRKKLCFVQGQGQKYGQKHETKELVQFYNHLHALNMVWCYLLGGWYKINYAS